MNNNDRNILALILVVFVIMLGIMSLLIDYTNKYHLENKGMNDDFSKSEINRYKFIGDNLGMQLSNYSKTGYIRGQTFIGDNLSMQLPDYSKVGYTRIYPQNESKFIYLECINSTMKIIDNKLECIK